MPIMINANNRKVLLALITSHWSLVTMNMDFPQTSQLQTSSDHLNRNLR